MSMLVPESGVGEVEPAMSRRSLLWSALGGLAAVLGGGWVGTWLELRRERSRGSWAAFEVEGGAQLARGRAIAFDLPDDAGRALLIHTESGLRAFASSCPHLGCPVLWSDETQRIECPCHAAAFDADSGRVLSGPPPRGLTPFDVASRDGRVVVAPRPRTA